MDDRPTHSRRVWLLRAATLAGAAATAAVVPVREAYAQKASKESMKYQDKPGPNNQTCDGCTYFQVPRKCGIVEGDIDPKGWCVAWNKKG